MKTEIEGAKFTELAAMYEATKDEIRRHGRQTEYQRRCLLCEDTGFVDIGYCKDGYHWVWPCECRKKGA